MKSRTRFSLIAPSLVLFAAVGAALGCGRSEGPPKEVATAKTVQAPVLRVIKSRGASYYVATGSVRAELNAVLASKVTGRVIDVAVREGDTVQGSQLLVSLDDRELRAAANIAGANLHSSVVGVDNASTAALMEERTSAARIGQAESSIAQAEAALAAAVAKRDLTLAGPRVQEVTQSHLAVVQAQSSLSLAKIELERATSLVKEGAIARRDLDVAQNRYDVAKAQCEAAVQGENIAKEGSRSQDIRAAEEAVSQASAAVKQARANLEQAKAASLQTSVRQKEVDVARAQVRQASASVQSAQVALSYGRLYAPFMGRVVRRYVDPGALASPGAPLLGIEGGEYRLEASVPEMVLPSLRKGSQEDVTIDALGGGLIRTKIAEIVPQADAASHSFIVKCSLSKDAAVRSGMFGKLRVRTGMQDQMLIPRTATWVREGLSYVFALDADHVARLRIVTLGDRVGDRVDVLSGLNEGDIIVGGRVDGVADGDKIEGQVR